MATEPNTIHVRSDSELAEALWGATETREPLFVDTGETVFEVHVHATESSESVGSRKPYSIRDIAGLGASGTPGSIADHKHEHIADAIDPRPR